jgi:hypothetical protein
VGVALEVLVQEFVRVQFRAVRRQEEKPDFIGVRLQPVLDLRDFADFGTSRRTNRHPFRSGATLVICS